MIPSAPDVLKAFELKNMPFQSNIDTDFLYENPKIRENLGKLMLAAAKQKFVVLSGLPGTGKSTLLRKLHDNLEPKKYELFYAATSCATPRWIYINALKQLGVKPRFFVNDLRWQLHDEFRAISAKGKNIVCFFDEGHLLSSVGHGNGYNNLEEIRFFINTRYDSQSPVTLILSGQNEIWDYLNQERCVAIAQRIDLICQTEPLSADEIEKYICAHLAYAEAKDNLFSGAAIDLITEFSGGIPRVINKICEHALCYIAAAGKTRVGSSDINNLILNHEIPECVINISKNSLTGEE